MPLGDESERWKWENAVAGAGAGFATVAALHPLDVVRTRFQVTDGRASHLPLYNNTAHALYSIARTEGVRGLYAGFFPAVFGSTVSWGLYFFFYSRAKSMYLRGNDEHLTPLYHLVSAAEAGAMVSLFTNPIWLVKTRLQLQTPYHGYRTYSGFSDALRTILKEEGWQALYKGIGPSLLLVTHGAIQFTVYEELRRLVTRTKGKGAKTNALGGDESLSSFDYAALGASSKIVAILFTYPYQVIRSRLQQRPNINGTPKYSDSWHVIKETARFEGLRGFYRGLTSNLLKNIPASSITFVVYENVLRILRLSGGEN
ncbi:folate transporter 1, chloroplastic-like [Zingiber officinale]|uniref:folate transporter 1, chloroplastic-like n=1 Tax=Zingiber officinale TaxID=94328 RepID=UPI001C4B600A|nr:folate transporter 1, chloroplastic-like [Zingiber officinale]